MRESSLAFLWIELAFRVPKATDVNKRHANSSSRIWPSALVLFTSRLFGLCFVVARMGFAGARRNFDCYPRCFSMPTGSLSREARDWIAVLRYC